MNDIISSAAMGLGFIQLYGQVKSVDEININMKNTILLSILTSSLWLVFQYRKYGINATTFYTSSGLIVQLYILNRILVKEKDSK